jgi:hypothetical protein
MSTLVLEKVTLVLCLFALACDAKPADAAPAPGGTAAARTACRVCGAGVAPDRAVVVRSPGGDVIVCSQGCAIRWEVAEGPAPASLPAETRPEEDR